MKISLFYRREVWWPTVFGWGCVFLLLPVPFLAWVFGAEHWLSQDAPATGAAVLVVESWIGREGVRAAKAEFDRGGYQRIVTTGGSGDNLWAETPRSDAWLAGQELLGLGVPEERLLVADCGKLQSERTFHFAQAVRKGMDEAGWKASAINVFTRGVHVRRSRMVFAKVMGPATSVGSITWRPADEKDLPWWKSSSRSKDLLTESAGYLYEWLASSGRTSG